MTSEFEYVMRLLFTGIIGITYSVITVWIIEEVKSWEDKKKWNN